MSYTDNFESALVCPDRLCPKVFDPHRNVVMCRCYQIQATSPLNANPLPASVPGTGSAATSPPSYPSSLQYGDYQTVPQSSVNYPPSYLGYTSGYDACGIYSSMYPQLSPNMSNPEWSMYSAQQASQYCPQSTQMDQMLRSQVTDFLNYQHLSNQVNGSDIPATKQSTKLLKTWLREHKKNPYPTKTEKVMLAFAARMTMTQISNWFANARRRMKQQKDKGNTSDSALSDISDDDDRTPTPLTETNTSLYSRESGVSNHHTDLNSYLKEREQLMKIHKPIRTTEGKLLEAPVTVKKEPTNSILATNTEIKNTGNASKIWSISSMLS